MSDVCLITDVLICRLQICDINTIDVSNRDNMDLGSSGSSLEGALGELGSDKELQEFIMKEQQQEIFREAINKMTETCWEKCIPGAPGKSLDGKTESCISNCVERFIDTSLQLTERLQKLGQQH